jgi:hypothetical protein
MFTVVETSVFQKQWPLYWSEEERGEFAAYIAAAPKAGDVVPHSGGIRKVRWRRAGTGKSGGGARHLFHAYNRRRSRTVGYVCEGRDR